MNNIRKKISQKVYSDIIEKIGLSINLRLDILLYTEEKIKSCINNKIKHNVSIEIKRGILFKTI